MVYMASPNTAAASVPYLQGQSNHISFPIECYERYVTSYLWSTICAVSVAKLEPTILAAFSKPMNKFEKPVRSQKKAACLIFAVSRDETSEQDLG